MINLLLGAVTPKMTAAARKPAAVERTPAWQRGYAQICFDL